MKTLLNPVVRQEIASRIGRLSAADGRLWGTMSVHQMICHLRDSYCIALGERAVTSATGPLQRILLKLVALWLPIPWRQGYATRPEVEQGNGGSPPTDFESDRKALELVLNRFCTVLPRPCLPHPVFGPMRAHDWLRWGYLHADHHLRQFGR